MPKQTTIGTKAMQATDAMKEFFTSLDTIDGVKYTIRVNLKFLEGYDKRTKKAITDAIEAFNEDGLTASFRAYDIYEDKNGRTYVLVSKYGLKINGTPVTDKVIAQAIHDGCIKMFVSGFKPGHYDAGLVFLGKVTLAEPDDQFPNSALLRSAIRKNCL